MEKIVIFGATSFAEIANAYFSQSGYEVVGHLVDPGYRGDILAVRDSQVAELDTPFAKEMIGQATHFYAALTYTNLNRARTSKVAYLKGLGLKPASYISPHAFIDPSATLGEHVFIFENNTIQYGVSIGSNSIFWSGNHIGHHSKINENVFISSHVVISGHVEVGQNSFLGVNCTIQNNLSIGSDNWISPNSLIHKSTGENEMYRTTPAEKVSVTPRRYFKIES